MGFCEPLFRKSASSKFRVHAAVSQETYQPAATAVELTKAS